MSGSVTSTLGKTGEGGFTSTTNSSESDTVELGDVTWGQECELLLSEVEGKPLFVLVRDLVLLLGLWDDLGEGGRKAAAGALDAVAGKDGGGGGGSDGGGRAMFGDGNCSLILHFPLELAAIQVL